MARRKFGRAQGRRTVVKVLGGTASLSFGDTADVIRFYEDAERRLNDLSEPLDQYGRYTVEEHIPRQFAARGTPKRWASLSAKYAAWKAKYYPGRPLLVLSGRMKAGFRWKARKRSLQIINRVTAGQKGNNTPRWRWHQDGTPRMPARPMLQVTDKDLAELSRLIFAHVRGE